MLSAKKISFRHMGRIRFPSSAAVASERWMNYEDYIEIPSLDLMRNMEMTGASHIIILCFKNIHTLMEELNTKYEIFSNLIVQVFNLLYNLSNA